MRVFAIADLHLSFARPKPMDVFGGNWADHDARIREAWQELVRPQDLVLVPGDISWAMKLEDAQPDLDFIARLNGTKLLLRGNHDYWWNSLKKVRSNLPEGMLALQNDSFDFGSFCVCGSRGWTCEGARDFTNEDEKIYLRELARLELSLKAAARRPILAMTHFPPFGEGNADSGFSALYEQYGVSVAVYGHLHNRSCAHAFEGERGGVAYHLVSADHLGFVPKLIYEA